MPAEGVGVSRRAFVVSAGATAESVAIARLPLWTKPMVIAADGGYGPALSLGFAVTAVVGDCDSIDPAALAAIDRDITEVVTHPRDKDATDLELAIQEAIRRGAKEVCVVDCMRGRIDHFLASIALLAAAQFRSVAMSACIGSTRVWVANPERSFAGEIAIGATVSLVPIGDVDGIVTAGLQYPLHRETLLAGTSRGVSNVCISTPIGVAVETGTLLVVDEGIVQ
jgi:thiamine pyrophosphokinase